MNFLEFMTEKALDPSLAGAASIRQTGEGVVNILLERRVKEKRQG